jgi:hypothetical protein
VALYLLTSPPRENGGVPGGRSGLHACTPAPSGDCRRVRRHSEGNGRTIFPAVCLPRDGRDGPPDVPLLGGTARLARCEAAFGRLSRPGSPKSDRTARRSGAVVTARQTRILPTLPWRATRQPPGLTHCKLTTLPVLRTSSVPATALDEAGATDVRDRTSGDLEGRRSCRRFARSPGAIRC